MAAPQRGPPWVFPPSQVKPLWCARLPPVGGAPKDRKGDFPRGQSRCRNAGAREEAPPRDGGCALRGLRTRAGPPRGQRAPVTNRLGTPHFGGQCVGGYRGARRGDCGWCHDSEPGSSPSSYRPTADTVHGNAKIGCTRPLRGLVGGRGPWLTPSTPSPGCPGCCLTRPELGDPCRGRSGGAGSLGWVAVPPSDRGGGGTRGERHNG
jgi:hypothetical protein